MSHIRIWLCVHADRKQHLQTGYNFAPRRLIKKGSCEIFISNLPDELPEPASSVAPAANAATAPTAAGSSGPSGIQTPSSLDAVKPAGVYVAIYRPQLLVSKPKELAAYAASAVGSMQTGVVELVKKDPVETENKAGAITIEKLSELLKGESTINWELGGAALKESFEYAFVAIGVFTEQAENEALEAHEKDKAVRQKEWKEFVESAWGMMRNKLTSELSIGDFKAFCLRWTCELYGISVMRVASVRLVLAFKVY